MLLAVLAAAQKSSRTKQCAAFCVGEYYSGVGQEVKEVESGKVEK